jgi:hypothetical protein
VTERERQRLRRLIDAETRRRNLPAIRERVEREGKRPKRVACAPR